MGQPKNELDSKVIKGRVIPASEIEKRLENPAGRSFRLKGWFECCNFDIFSSIRNCLSDKIKEKKTPELYSNNEEKKRNKCIELPNQKLKKILSQKSTVYCVDQPKLDVFNKSFETDIDSNKQDNVSTGFELDVNNTLRRTFSNTLYELRASKTVSQQSNYFSMSNLNEREQISTDHEEPITFSNLFGNLDNFLNDGSLEFDSNYDSESDRESQQSHECDNLSYSNSEAFYEQTIVYEYITRF